MARKSDGSAPKGVCREDKRVWGEEWEGKGEEVPLAMEGKRGDGKRAGGFLPALRILKSPEHGSESHASKLHYGKEGVTAPSHPSGSVLGDKQGRVVQFQKYGSLFPCLVLL